MSTNGKHLDFVKVSAPGKVILHGEHSVVYGKLAVALSVDLRTHLSVSVSGDSVVIDLPIVDIKESWPLDTFKDLWQKHRSLQEGDSKSLNKKQSQCLREFLDIAEDVTDPKKLAVLAFFHLYMAILPEPLPLSILVSSQLPTGAGLGSSAAYAVCLAGALLHISGTLDLSQLSSSDQNLIDNVLKNVCQWAFTSEQIVHGTPSGIDNSVCTYGGAVSFKSGDISPLQIPALKVLLVNTGVPRSTKALVGGVRQRKERLPEVVDPILDSLHAIADCGLKALQSLASAADEEERNSTFQTIEELVHINHALLCALGVSHPSLDKLVGIAKANGLHAKLTGAGGGGFGFVVISPSITESTIKKCCEELQQSGYEVWTTNLGAPGLTFHSK